MIASFLMYGPSLESGDVPTEALQETSSSKLVISLDKNNRAFCKQQCLQSAVQLPTTS